MSYEATTRTGWCDYFRQRRPRTGVWGPGTATPSQSAKDPGHSVSNPGDAEGVEPANAQQSEKRERDERPGDRAQKGGDHGV